MKQLKKAVSQKMNRFMAVLNRQPQFLFLKRLLAAWKEDDGADRAAAISYYAFMAIFPLLLGLVALLGFFLPDENVRQVVSDALAQALPGSADFIEESLDEIIRLRGASSIISILGLLWSGSNLFTAVRRSLNRAWGIKEERNFIVGKARDLALVLGIGVLFLLSMASNSVVNFVGESEIQPVSLLISIGSRLLGFLLVLLVFLIIYKWMPNVHAPWRWTWPGGLLAAVLFEAGIYIFIFFLTNFATFQLVYGPLASVIVFLLWIYLSAIILIIGVEVNSELYKASKRKAQVSP